MAVLILSHHKTGTTFCRKVLEILSNHKVLEFVRFDENNKITEESVFNKSIFFHSHPTVYEVDLIKSNVDQLNIVHFIRQPRNLIVSSLQYHLKGREDWLNEARDDLMGKTYQEHLQDLDFEDGLIFEMHNMSYWNIKNMHEIAKQFQTTQIKLEELSHDRTLQTAWRFVESLGLDGTDKLNALTAAVRNSLWFGDNANLPHVTTGASMDLLSAWTEQVEQEFIKTFPYDFSVLGYEQ